LSDAPGYTDEQVALILRKAAELEAARGSRSTALMGTGAGLSHDQLRQIAREVGIDPELIDEAAELVRHQDHDWRTRVLGAGSLFHETRHVRGPLTESDVRALLDLAQVRVGRSGTVANVLDSTEWSDGESLGPTRIRFSDTDSAAKIEVTAHRRDEADLIGVFSVLGGFVVTMLAGAVTEPVTTLGLAGVIGTGVATATAGIRFGWRAVAAGHAKRIRELADDLAAHAARLGERSGDEDDG
jgi:hypothetical protein